MSEYNLKSIRKMFAENGVFYTDKALAEMLKSYMPDDATEVYDPTCGCGNLLAVFGDDVDKYGQELNAEQAAEAAKLPNAHIVAGDTLKNPAFTEKKFRAIVANYPFSVKWTPDETDARFRDAPCTAPPSKADWAFLLHIIHYLSEDGVAAILNYPGALYRGQREKKIRQWVVDAGYIHEIVRIEGNHFVDTPTETALMILRKRPAMGVRFADNALGIERVVQIDEIKANGYDLSVRRYIEPKEDPQPEVDKRELEQSARSVVLRKIKLEIEVSLTVADLEGWSADEFIEDIISLANSYRKQPTTLNERSDNKNGSATLSKMCLLG